MRDLMQRGVADGVFPGGVLLVAKKDRVVFLEAFGHARLTPERPMTIDTVFDLASLTKPLATTLVLMLLVQQGKLSPDQTLGMAIPDFSGTNKEYITIRQLLSHTSGLPDYRPYYTNLVELSPSERKGSLRALLLAEELIQQPGQASLYSDVGFMILQWIVEVTAQKSLDSLVEESICQPLGLKDLFFVTLNLGAEKDDRPYAATEDCPWRGKILDGVVHDENAYALGGVGGHAGLFGTAQDVYRVLKDLFDVYAGKPNRGLFRRDVLQTFLKRQSDVGSWALGFDTPTRPDSSSGRYFSDQSVGHLGFSGTSFWVDLLKGVIVILLTNRIHPKRENVKIRAFRPLLHDTVMDSIVRQKDSTV
ncbi:MAG TPA: class A beta-lactamase-related serine hydrolase [Desulfobacterales bacterium]|nr:class A beta-lactamase-related serine hydrolase [Desulfobacterales bacterium]